MIARSFAIAVASLFMLSVAAQAETKCTVSGTHLCCPQCVSIVGSTLKDIPGVKGECSQKDKTITLTCDSNEACQKAIDALAAAGFYGKLDNKDIKYKDIAVPTGNVTKLEVSGVHNCCGQCAKIISTAVGKVKGVNATPIGAKKESFTVEGDFSAKELVDALLAEGFYGQVKK